MYLRYDKDVERWNIDTNVNIQQNIDTNAIDAQIMLAY